MPNGRFTIGKKTNFPFASGTSLGGRVQNISVKHHHVDWQEVGGWTAVHCGQELLRVALRAAAACKSVN